MIVTEDDIRKQDKGRSRMSIAVIDTDSKPNALFVACRSSLSRTTSMGIMVASWGWSAWGQLRQRRYLLSTLVLGHLRHTGVLTTLVLLLKLLVVQSLLLLLLSHVAGIVSRGARHSRRRLRHARDIIRRSNVIATVNAVLAAGFWSVEAGLDEVLAFGLCDERLELGSCESVDQTSLRDDQQKNLGASED
jgi:hypothetical protein